MFAAAVRALRRRSHQSGERAHHKNASAAALAHVRQNGARDAQHAEEIGFKLRAPVFHREVFDGSRMLTRLTWSEIPRQRFSAAASAVLRGSLCYLEPGFSHSTAFLLP